MASLQQQIVFMENKRHRCKLVYDFMLDEYGA
jgi:hypothetical protein